ncbi:hypothetical protein [Halpernia frigidisoli]|uniref:Uncharacterized protein n=1 Tax=Halpernia frigidisoli TaxID=1125876 RepID=A0A1I3GZL7_9FLAO|nr:hypothetical protein [Halpernia frigidisoli]SFI28730.1 hypothetical protein SAMN05443292_2105 [Halpernia frigidisoli]
MKTIKNLALTLLLTFTGINAFAQTAYETAMKDKVMKVQQSQSADELGALANDFSRIALKENKEWLPQYYAAYADIQKGRILMRANDLSQLDALADDAQKHIDIAQTLSPNNVELTILEKMSHSMRMMVDPQSRFMSEGSTAAELLATAEKMDPENPRISLLKAEDTYYTPEQYGGSKEKGIELFKKAQAQFAVYKSKSALDPTWGKEEADYFLSQVGK